MSGFERRIWQGGRKDIAVHAIVWTDLYKAQL